MPADPEQLGLVKFILSLIENSKWQELVVTLGFLYAPGIAAWVIGLFKKDKATAAYQQLVNGKDAEISRLAAQVKDLQNAVFRTRR